MKKVLFLGIPLLVLIVVLALVVGRKTEPAPASQVLRSPVGQTEATISEAKETAKNL
jgi:hypothetical protein